MKKYKLDSEEVMFTSDNHFGHANIIKHCDRPFKDAHHMNVEMTDRWNAVVRPDQTVFHIGDFAFRGRDAQHYLDMLNGKVILIRGNHDRPNNDKFFHEVHDLAELVVDKDQRIIMCHYAMRTWNHSFRGSWMIHGHSHGTLPLLMDRKSLDMGVDCWNYTPISYPQLAAAMALHGQEALEGED